eukprot:scaffold10373_cov118-Isochrysis_galbana.AAC.20
MAGGVFWNPVTRYIVTRLNGLTSYVPPPPKEDGAAPRRILLVDAHPCEESFSAAIANAVVAGAKQGGERDVELRACAHSSECPSTYSARSRLRPPSHPLRSGHELRRHSLYAENYQPCLTAAERRAHHDRAKTHAPDVARALEDLTCAPHGAALFY